MSSGKGHKAAFIIELAAIFMALVLVTLVFTRVFSLCRSKSDRAAMLNESVLLAVSAAEMASASPDMDILQDTMASAENAVGHKSIRSSGDDPSSGSVWILASSGEDGGRTYIVRVSRRSEEGSTYAGDVIEVFDAGGAENVDDIDLSSPAEPVYALETGSRHGKEAGS